MLLKYFRNIASGDLNALFPNVRVVMSNIDKLLLGLPALAGGIPILLNLYATITVLFLVPASISASARPSRTDMKTALAALSGLVALGGFIMRQWVKYQRQSLKYQKELTDNIYFRNINNNAGIFDYIIGAAEEQECKEAFLAYHFLRAARAADAGRSRRPHRAMADETFGVDLGFDIAEASTQLGLACSRATEGGSRSCRSMPPSPSCTTPGTISSRGTPRLARNNRTMELPAARETHRSQHAACRPNITPVNAALFTARRWRWHRPLPHPATNGAFLPRSAPARDLAGHGQHAKIAAQKTTRFQEVIRSSGLSLPSIVAP